MPLAIPIPVLWAVWRLVRFIGLTMRRAWQTEEFRGLAYIVLLMMGIGTLVFHQVEGWGWLDSFYFVVMTLSTIGYGDFAPASTMGKLFAVFYVVLGLGIFASFITLFAQHALAENTEHARVLSLSKTPQNLDENTNPQESNR